MKLCIEQLIADLAHAEEKAATLCGPCADDHARLAGYLRALLAAHEQEPVGWIVHAHGGDQLTHDGGYVANAEGMHGIHSTPLYAHPAPSISAIQPVMFIDGDISSEDADKLAKVIREFNEEDERPLAKMARTIRENPHPTNECDMPKVAPSIPAAVPDEGRADFEVEFRRVFNVDPKVQMLLELFNHGTDEDPDFDYYSLAARDAWKWWRAGRAAMLQAEPQSAPQNIPENIPDGYALVPVEPTEDMVIHGFESEPSESFSESGAWEAYNAMSGCQQAAHRTKLCWAAMIAAAPKSSHFRENSNSSTELFREIGETSTKCWCRTCRPVNLSDMRFVVCPDCGNKRCPKANDHRNACSGSNEPGQEGSAYPVAPKGV